MGFTTVPARPLSRVERLNKERGEAFVTRVVGVNAVVGQFVPVVVVHARAPVSVQNAQAVPFPDPADDAVVILQNKALRVRGLGVSAVGECGQRNLFGL